MHATIKVTMDNDAFTEPNCELELSGILRELAERVDAGERERTIRDSNGNTVGHFRIVGQPRRFAR